ncbi:MAG: hypothetical protein Q8P67_07190, partial [archaeon]|nr:hypothetical protein [archaeon]
KTLVDEQMLRNGTFPHKRVSCLLQRAILSSISTQRETLGLYVAHIFALFSLLQSGSCVASRRPIPFINSSSTPTSSSSPSSPFDFDTSSCVRAFTRSGQLWAKIRLRSINNSARRRIQVLATVQLLLDCHFLVPSDKLSAWLANPEQHAHLAALRIDVYILHLKWVAPNGFSDLARMSSKVLDDRIPAYLALASTASSTADPQLIPTAAHHLQKAEQKGNHRCFVIAALFYHGMLHSSSSPSSTPGSDIFLQLLTIVMNTSPGFHLFPDAEIASWVDSLLTIDPSLFWKFVPRSFASPEASFPGHGPFEVSAFSSLTESQNSEYRVSESRSLRWLVLCKQVPRFHDVIREFLADHRQLHLCYHAFSEDQLSGIFALLASDRLTHLSLSKSHGFTGELFLRDMSRFQSLKHLSLNDISCLPPDVLVGLGATLPASLCSLRLSSTQMPTEFLGALISQRPSVAASLEALDYSNQRGTNDDDLRRTLVLMTRLTSLNLSSCPKMTSKTVSMLAQSLSGSLTRLIIRSNKCIDSSALQDISLHLTKLTNLDLTMCKQLRCDSFSRIDGLSSLQHLSLQGCDRIGPEAALQVCRSLPFLETLNLRSALVEPPSPAAQDIINAAVACLLGHPPRHPLTLLLGGCRQVAALPLIRFLSECCGAGVDRLAGLDLGSTSLALPTSSSQQLLKSLSSSLPGSPSRTSSISSFSSSFTSSSSSSATGQVNDETRISSLFVKFNSLLSVSLAGLSISDHDLNGLQQHRGLERVILSGCIRLTSGAALIVSQLPQVRLLDLKRTGVNDRGLEVIASQCGMIEELVLEGCAMLSDAACRSIGKLSKLRDLSLKQCSLISAAGIRNLCPQRRSPICRLNLESISPRFGDQGVLHLSRQFGNLQSLNLAALIEITDASLLVLAQSLLELRSLDLSFLGVSQECVQHIIAHAASLRTLFLVKCPKILQSSIDWKASGIKVVVKEATHALVAGVKQQAQARNERIRAQVIQDMSLAAGSEVDVRRVVDEKIREGVESRWARSSYSPNNLLKVYCMEKTLPVFQSLMKKMSSQEEQSDS